MKPHPDAIMILEEAFKSLIFVSSDFRVDNSAAKIAIM
jgi:hypothetical protein